MNAFEKKNNLDNYIIKPILKRFNVPENEMNYYCSFYINGVSAILIEWVKNNCKDNIDTIVKIIKECVRPDYEYFRKDK